MMAAASPAEMLDLMTSAARRWCAALALIAGLAAVVLVVAVAGTKTLALVLVLAGAIVVLLVGAWMVLAHRGIGRGIGALLILAALVTVVIGLVRKDLLWAVLVAVGLGAASVAAGRAALTSPPDHAGPEPEAVQPAEHPFLIMNPRSGDGKAGRFGLKEKAEALGV